MIKNTLLKSAFSVLTVILLTLNCRAHEIDKHVGLKNVGAGSHVIKRVDSIPPKDVLAVVKTVIYALNTFNIESVADLYTPNAVVADDEPPYSWNGPTAGVQWVNAVEKLCKENRLTKLTGTIESINVYQHSADNVYIVVPVRYTADVDGKDSFLAEGGFTFVLRMINGKWMIKSQVWMPRKGM